MTVTPGFINQVGGRGGVAAEGQDVASLTGKQRETVSRANRDNQMVANPLTAIIPGYVSPAAPECSGGCK